MVVKINPTIILVFLATLIGVLFLSLSPCGDGKDTSGALLQQVASLQEANNNLTIEKASLSKAVGELSKDNHQLLNQVVELEAKGETVRYIDVIKYRTREVVIEVEVLPEEHLYVTEEGLAICRFSHDETFKFEVLPVDYTINVVKSDTEESISLIAKDYTSKEVLLPVDVNKSSAVAIRKYPKFEPHFSLGVGLDHLGNIDPVIAVPLFHMNENVDIFSPRINFGQENLGVGVSVVDYNIGNNIKFLTDTWIGIGPNYTQQGITIQGTITSKF